MNPIDLLIVLGILNLGLLLIAQCTATAVYGFLLIKEVLK